MLNTKKILTFAIQFLPLFVIFLIAYPYALPIFEAITIPPANLVLGLFSPPIKAAVLDSGAWQFQMLISGVEWRDFLTMQASDLQLIYINLALLPALLLATPVSLIQRLKLFGYGLILLLIFQVITAIGLGASFGCIVLDEENLFCGWMAGIFTTGSQIFTFALWGLLTWRFWFKNNSN